MKSGFMAIFMAVTTILGIFDCLLKKQDVMIIFGVCAIAALTVYYTIDYWKNRRKKTSEIKES